MIQLSFFVGKGGVGKTTISAAFAVCLARKEKTSRVTLLSTDPAHSLADIFQQPLSSAPRKVEVGSRARLTVWQVNAEKEFRRFLGRYRKDLLGIFERGSIFSAEDIEPLLDTALPGMAEMAALLALQKLLSEQKDGHIVVDTAPFGHTLRLFELPEQLRRFLRFLEIAGDRDRILAEHFGGCVRRPTETLIEGWRAMAESLRTALQNAQVYLVTTPEKFSLNEALRCRTILRQDVPEVQIRNVILNRAVRPRGGCSICRLRAKATRSAQAFIKREFSGTQLLLAPETNIPVLGTSSLAAFGEHTFGRRPLKLRLSASPRDEAKLGRARWPVLNTPLTLVLGKGGVGKTTISAALGFCFRSTHNGPVEICSVDPAPSLDDVFQEEIGDQPRPVLGDRHFQAAEFDSVRLFRNWVSDLKATIEQATTTQASGVHLDLSFERRLLCELLDIVPPGIDEVIATLHILDLLAGPSKKIVIDMAPTGHALELLRTPARLLTWSRLLLKTLATHRTLGFAQDAAVRVAEVSERVRELRSLLLDPHRTRICLVMLAEPLPDRETERLVRELKSLGLAPQAIFVNRLVLKAKGCRRCEISRRSQSETLARLRHQYRDMDFYAIPDFGAEIAGRRALQSFTRGLWELS